MLHLEDEEEFKDCFSEDEQSAGRARTSRNASVCDSLLYARAQGLLEKREVGVLYLPDHSRIYFCRKRETAELRASPYTRFAHFPQEPTTDQNFDQWQFKAYRHLGFETTRKAMEKFDVVAKPECPGPRPK